MVHKIIINGFINQEEILTLSNSFFHELELEDYELKMLYQQNMHRDELSDDVKQPLCNALDKFRDEYENEPMALFDLFLLQEIARRWTTGDCLNKGAYVRGAGYYRTKG